MLVQLLRAASAIVLRPAVQRNRGTIVRLCNVSHSCSGCHRCVCVELKLHFLLLNAVLQAPQLAEAEGTDLEQARGGRTIAVLRSLLAGWAADASARCAPFLAEACLLRSAQYAARST